MIVPERRRYNSIMQSMKRVCMEQLSTILIVDDNPHARDILAALLEPEGYRLAFAENGTLALDMARELIPDLILLDVMMPEIDGYTVCKMLRADPELALVPVVMVTALDDQPSIMRGFEAGADDFITKPFNRIELRARVRNITHLNRYRRLLSEQARVVAERSRFLWVVDQSDDGYVVLEEGDKIRYTNRQGMHYLGLTDNHNEALLASFLGIVTHQYHCEPPEAWIGWPDQITGISTRYLVRPETLNSMAFWLQVDVFDAPGHEMVVRLRNVSEQIAAQRNTWTFHALIEHKLRTPLVGMGGGMMLLASRADALEPSVISKIANIAMKNVERLQSEIEDILSYLHTTSRRATGPECQICQIYQIAQQISTEMDLQPLLISGNAIEDDSLLVLSTQTIAMVLRELLENARKFHPQRSPAVELKITYKEPASVRLCVADDGLTLSPEQLAHAWTPYYQGEKTFTGQIVGMGLGLPTVARLIWGIGGECKIANRSGQLGVVVELVIPRS